MYTVVSFIITKEYIKKDFLFLLVEKSLTYFLTQYAICQQTNKTIDINSLIKQSISFSIDLFLLYKSIQIYCFIKIIYLTGSLLLLKKPLTR